jgi:hypothetical protein
MSNKCYIEQGTRKKLVGEFNFVFWKK